MIFDKSQYDHTLLVRMLGTITATYVFIDMVRRLFDGSQWLLLVLDFSLVLMYAVFFVYVKKGQIFDASLFNSYVFLSLMAHVGMVIIQAFNQGIPSLVLTLAALRTYLLSVPMVFVGYYIAKNFGEKEYRKIYIFLCVLVCVSVVFSAYQFFVDKSTLPLTLQILVTPMTTEVHNYGDEIVNLSSSFFAAAKRYANFLFVSYLFLWAISKNYGYKIFPFFVIILFGLIISGAREGLWLFVFFHLAVIAFVGRNKGIRTAAIIWILSIVTLASVINDGGDEGTLGLRAKFLMGVEDDLAGRTILLFPYFDIKWDNNRLMYGDGIGRYGQETQIYPHLLEHTKHSSYDFFNSRDFFNSAISYADSGLAKITIEMGIIGLTIFTFFMTSSIILSVRFFYKNMGDFMLTTMAAVVISWFFLFLKTHAFLSNTMMSSVFFMAIGYMLFYSVNRRKQEAGDGYK